MNKEANKKPNLTLPEKKSRHEWKRPAMIFSLSLSLSLADACILGNKEQEQEYIKIVEEQEQG